MAANSPICTSQKVAGAEFTSVSGLYCYITTYCKCKGLQECLVTVLQKGKIGLARLSSLRVSEAEIKVLAELGTCLKALVKNLLPSSSRLLAESSSLWLKSAIPFFFWPVVNWGPSPPPRGCLYSFSQGSLRFQSQQ